MTRETCSTRHWECEVFTDAAYEWGETGDTVRFATKELVFAAAAKTWGASNIEIVNDGAEKIRIYQKKILPTSHSKLLLRAQPTVLPTIHEEAIDLKED